MKFRKFQPAFNLLVWIGFATIAFAQEKPYSTKIEPQIKLSEAPQAYMNRCFFCHDYAVGPMLRGRGLDANYVKTIVRNGSRAMPQFRHTEVTDDELTQITKYLSAIDPAMVQSQESTGDLKPGDPTRGAAVYNVSCITCHGPKGRADGIVAATLQPPVIDFHNPESLKKAPEELRKTIMEGKPGTAMPSWKPVLSSQDIEDVLSYVLTLRK